MLLLAAEFWDFLDDLFELFLEPSDQRRDAGALSLGEFSERLRINWLAIARWRKRKTAAWRVDQCDLLLCCALANFAVRKSSVKRSMSRLNFCASPDRNRRACGLCACWKL